MIYLAYLFVLVGLAIFSVVPFYPGRYILIAGGTNSFFGLALLTIGWGGITTTPFARNQLAGVGAGLFVIGVVCIMIDSFIN